MAGTLFLIAGPSGAGKDTLLSAVRDDLGAGGTHIFPKRLITRAPAVGDEDHIALSDAEFDAVCDRGGLAFEWSAYGYRYGIDRAIFDDLAAGRHVVVNVSRTIVMTASKTYPITRFVLIDAPAETLRARLAVRGREGAAIIENRFKRAGSVSADRAPDHVVRNTGSVAEGARVLRDILVSPMTT